MKDFFLKIPGLMSWEHLFFVVVAYILVFLFTFLYFKKGLGKGSKIIRVAFWCLVICEVAKILYNIFYRHAVINDYLPLYFCSLTIFASGMSSYGNKSIKYLGNSFLLYGGIVSGCLYLLYPSSALPIHPLLHPLTIHSMLFHVTSVVLGVIVIKEGFITINIKDVGPYLIFTYSASLIAYIVNITCKTNFMFLNDPWTIEPLKLVKKVFGPVYPLIIATGQNVGTFFITYGVLKLVNYIKTKKEEKKNAQ